MESKAFHICPFCRAPSLVSAQRCKGCGRSLLGLPLAVYGSEIHAALAYPSPKTLMDLTLRERPPRPAPAARRRPAPAAMRRPAREPRPGAIVGMAAALAAAIGTGATLVRPRPAQTVRPSITKARQEATARVTTPPVAVRAKPTASEPTPVASARVSPSLAREILPHEASARVAWSRASAALEPPAPAPDDEVTAPDEGALVLRAQLRRAEESRDRLADRVDRLRARLNVPVVTDVDRYQRLQDELETAREDLDRADADVARWRRALSRVG